MKKIAILGITGSIGTSACEVVRRHSDRFRIVLASAHCDAESLLRLALEFGIPNSVITGEKAAIFDTPVGLKIHKGREILLELLERCDCDMVLNAVPGNAGLEYTMQTVKMGRNLALANKESLVMAGHLVMPQAAASGSVIVPVDSEHSALFQAIGSHPGHEVRTLVLTASGGPFRDTPLEQFPDLTVEQTLRHPTWTMGAKVTVDSATMLNKGLETIEAHWLFDMPYDRIEAVIHPQSVVHSMVRFIDGSMLAQMSRPTMQLPILYAFTYPERIDSQLVETGLDHYRTLTFSEIDPRRYPLYILAREAGQAGGILPTVLNAAGEAAVGLFLNQKIRFMDMADVVEKELARTSQIENPDLDTVISVTHEVMERLSR